MTVRLITSQTELAALEQGWNRLADGLPLRSWDWLATWWKYYGQPAGGTRNTGRQLYVLAVVDDAGQLLGVAPWHLDRTIVRGSVLRWLGSGEVCTDHLSLICRPEDSQLVATEVADELTADHADWDSLELGAVDADDAPLAQLAVELEQRDCIVSRRPADACWVLDLPKSWDAYEAAVSKSHRKQLRRAERRVLESDRVRWHQVRSAEQLDEAWHVLVDLHQRRRQSLGEPGCFVSQAFHDFHRDAVDRLLVRSELRMSWLELDGVPAAAEYHVAGLHTTYAYQGGVDPDRLDDEPGRLSTILCLRAAIDEGHRQMDFLRGDEPYKAHWRATPHPTIDYRVLPNRSLARLRGRLLGVTGTVADWVKQGLVTSPAHVSGG
jgi:CelD/BcsL family acetyltransferase involved in cellulose biosynthesis